ncbi:hypothetical protein LCGC14_1188550 [marine sediment metagenome]|uniref:Uncharacterized protein n=1 Tax=marine sediment metagenome TaxID=412755 RepID=A0A0F9M7T3_9ZZZZ
MGNFFFGAENMNPDNILTCVECGWKGTVEERLKAKNPFLPKEQNWLWNGSVRKNEIHGCPKCKRINTFFCVCGVETCKCKDEKRGVLFSEGLNYVLYCIEGSEDMS